MDASYADRMKTIENDYDGKADFPPYFFLRDSVLQKTGKCCMIGSGIMGCCIM